MKRQNEMFDIPTRWLKKKRPLHQLRVEGPESRMRVTNCQSMPYEAVWPTVDRETLKLNCGRSAISLRVSFRKSRQRI